MYIYNYIYTRRPLPSIGLGGAAPGITAGVRHLQTCSISILIVCIRDRNISKLPCRRDSKLPCGTFRHRCSVRHRCPGCRATTQAAEQQALHCFYSGSTLPCGTFRHPLQAATVLPQRSSPSPRLQGCNPRRRTLHIF